MGMDIFGIFPLASGQLKSIVVAIDYFSKWIKVEPLYTIATKTSRTTLYAGMVFQIISSHIT